MQKLVIVIIILAVALIVAVSALSYKTLFSLVNLSPQAKLALAFSKLNSTKEMNVNYSLNLSILSSYMGSEGSSYSNSSIEIYKMGNDTKALISIGSAITEAVYREDNVSVACSESNLLGLSFGSNNTVSCSILNMSNSKHSKQLGDRLMAILNKTSVVAGAPGSVYGRSCNNYMISINQSELNQMINAVMNSTFNTTQNSTTEITSSLLSELHISGNINVGLCMDRSTGIPLRVNMSAVSYSAHRGVNVTTDIFEILARNVSTTVNPSVFKIPSEFVLKNLTCTNDTVAFNITSLTNSTNATATVRVSEYNASTEMSKNDTGSAALTSPLRFGKTYSAIAVLKSPLIPTYGTSYSYYFPSVCMAGDCQSLYCYVYSSNYNNNQYTTTIPYGYAITTTIPPQGMPIASVTPIVNNSDRGVQVFVTIENFSGSGTLHTYLTYPNGTTIMQNGAAYTSLALYNTPIFSLSGLSPGNYSVRTDVLYSQYGNPYIYTSYSPSVPFTIR
jgi:hypothetical protein